MQPHWKQPSHPEILQVVEQPGSFMTYAIAQNDFKPGAVLAHLSAPTLTLSPCAYSSVQVASTQNIELNSDFLYINHSCEPNVEFHVTSHGIESGAHHETRHPAVIDIRAAARKDKDGNIVGIQKGDELTFFYPSTEWDMSQPFECKCKTPSCKGVIRGAKHLSRDQLSTYFVNEHIQLLKMDQESGMDNGSGASNTSGGSGNVTPSRV